MKKFEIYENNGGCISFAILSESGDPLAIFGGWEQQEDSIIPAIDALMEDEDVWKVWDGDILPEAIETIERENSRIERENSRVSPEERQDLLPLPTVETIYNEISGGEWSDLQAWGDTVKGLAIRHPWGLSSSYILNALGDANAEALETFADMVEDWAREHKNDPEFSGDPIGYDDFRFDHDNREWVRYCSDSKACYILHGADGSILIDYIGAI